MCIHTCVCVCMSMCSPVCLWHVGKSPQPLESVSRIHKFRPYLCAVLHDHYHTEAWLPPIIATDFTLLAQFEFRVFLGIARIAITTAGLSKVSKLTISKIESVHENEHVAAACSLPRGAAFHCCGILFYFVELVSCSLLSSHLVVQLLLLVKVMFRSLLLPRRSGRVWC